MAAMTERKVMPLQRSPESRLGREAAVAPEPVYMAAYEVYSHVFRPQPALIEGHCRGGFGVGELVAFLYARSFPRDQWQMRVDEALTGLRT
jgi:hypothetical protein